MYKTQHTYNWKPEYGTSITGDSKTVPGESYSIQDLLIKARGGIPLTTLVNIKEGEFDSESDFDSYVPEPDHDIVDVMELHNNSREIIRDAQQKITESKSRKKKAKETPSEGIAEAKTDLDEELRDEQ